MRVVMGVIQATVAAVEATPLEAAVLLEVGVLLLQVTVLLLQATVSFLQAAVLLLQVAVIHREVEAIHREVAVTPCRQRSQVAVGLVVHLYRRPKRDMMFALRRTSLISQGLPLNRRRSRQSHKVQIHCLMWLQRNTLRRRWEARNS